MKCNLQVKNKKWWKKYFPHSSEIWFYDAVAQETSVSISGFKCSDVHFAQENTSVKSSMAESLLWWTCSKVPGLTAAASSCSWWETGPLSYLSSIMAVATLQHQRLFWFLLFVRKRKEGRKKLGRKAGKHGTIWKYSLIRRVWPFSFYVLHLALDTVLSGYLPLNCQNSRWLKVSVFTDPNTVF